MAGRPRSNAAFAVHPQAAPASCSAAQRTARSALRGAPPHLGGRGGGGVGAGAVRGGAARRQQLHLGPGRGDGQHHAHACRGSDRDTTGGGLARKSSSRGQHHAHARLQAAAVGGWDCESACEAAQPAWAAVAEGMRMPGNEPSAQAGARQCAHAAPAGARTGLGVGPWRARAAGVVVRLGEGVAPARLERRSMIGAPLWARLVTSLSVHPRSHPSRASTPRSRPHWASSLPAILRPPMHLPTPTALPATTHLRSYLTSSLPADTTTPPSGSSTTWGGVRGGGWARARASRGESMT